jgi:3-oxoacyl-[acyl-carrier-protein] synthase II
VTGGRKVVVSGLGVVSPLGNDVASFFESLCAGRSGIGRLSGRFPERLSCRIGGTVSFDGAAHFPGAKLRMLDRVSQFALAAAMQAVEDARLDFTALDRSRAGVFVGSGMGGAETADDGYYTLYGESSDRVKPFSVLMAMTNAPASWIGLEWQLTGPNLTFSTACSSSAVAIGEAARRIAEGEADIAIAGGAEAPLNFGTIKAWEALKTLAAEDPGDPGASCKPFARDRSGLVLGEGAAMLVLEAWDHLQRRGGNPRGEIAGYGLTTDAAHITRPTREAQSSTLAKELAQARLDPGDVGYINAHGTGTAANDGVETAAIKAVFGERAHAIPVSSTKSMHGHLLGAAGALELAATLLALEKGVLPPTINLRVPDPECDLDYVPLTARRAEGLRAALSSSFAFGGTNAVLAVRPTR